MSLDLAKLRLLQRQAGRAEADAAHAPSPLAAAAIPPTTTTTSRVSASASAAAATSGSAAAAAARHRPAQATQRPVHRDASTPLFEKEGLGEICSPEPTPQLSRPATSGAHSATDLAFLDEVLARPPVADADRLRRLIASRERRPGTDSSGQGESANARATAPSPVDAFVAQAAIAEAPIRTGETASRSRAARTDLDALRRLIALRERKPAAATSPPPSSSIGNPQEGVAAPAPPSVRRSLDRSLPGEEIAPGLHYLQAHLPLPVPAAALSLAFAKRADESVEPQRLLFFDTETTGLAGGTGTRAFMIGAADWHRDPQHGDGLRIRQLTIASLAAEPAMLREFARWLQPGTVLSSYNGRCYDAPLLNARYRLARQPNPLLGLDHLDLLFPTRRLYRGVWENCKLATIERELLRILREDDLPGAQAPAAWLHYLRGGSAALLRRVIAHNHQDLATLAQLLPRLVQAHAELAVAG